MKLVDYLAQTKQTPTGFAEKLGSPASTVTRLIRGERDPGLALMKRIREATGGAVTADDFISTGPAAAPADTTTVADPAAPVTAQDEKVCP